ncbi:fungal specific transcription factor domain-containing protein [Phlyctema vagabunda]|uniref:Fungal specific transcription factor domain-containing protein n=1 Tax=Phlyctema vagabunda TaxID=108571 RepID=A0ABR4P8G2_9HELO
MSNSPNRSKASGAPDLEGQTAPDRHETGAPKAPSSRKRLITSCSNCHRRKQKCNRRRPCNNCVTRKVGHECFYPSPSWSSQEPDPPSTAELKSKKPVSQDTISNIRVQDVFGYSSLKGSNAFIEADKTWNNSQGRADSSLRKPPAESLWQKYWHIAADLPSESMTDDLIATYFSEVSWIYTLLEPYYFRKALRQWREFTSSTSGSVHIETLSADAQCFPALLFQVLALTLQFLPPETNIEEFPDLNVLEISNNFTENGVELISLLGLRGTGFIAVQHDLCRAAWLKNRGRGTESWHTLGNSIRKSQELNLHRRSNLPQNVTADEFWFDQYKKQLWVNLYLWDANQSVMLGRPRLINSSDCDVEPPIEHDIPEDPESVHPLSLKLLPEAGRTPTSFSANMFMYAISHKIHDLRASGADKRGLKDYSIVQELHDSILSLMNDLPPAIRPSDPDLSWDSQLPVLPRYREKILAAAYSLLLALHRPHVAKHGNSRQKAVEAALIVLESQQRFFEIINRTHYSYFGNAFHTIDAVIVLTTVMTKFPTQDRNLVQQIEYAILQAIGRMCVIEPANVMAGAGLGILRSCYHTFKDVYGKIKHLLHSGPSAPIMTDLGSSNMAHLSPNSLDHINIFPGFEEEVTMDYLNPGPPLSRPEMEFISQQPNEVPMNEFGTSFWMGYMQQVFDDAADLPDPQMSWNSMLG